MKYLKLYEELNDDFYEWAKTKISAQINRNLINDIKDMSLEYLDEGLSLTIHIYCNSNINKVKYSGNSVYFCCIFFSHTKNEEEFYAQNLRFLDDDVILDNVIKITSQDFTYLITLDNDVQLDNLDWVNDDEDHFGDDEDFDEDDEIMHVEPQGINLQYYKSEDECMQKTKELTYRVVEAYPNENISWE